MHSIRIGRTKANLPLFAAINAVVCLPINIYSNKRYTKKTVEFNSLSFMFWSFN